MMRGSKMRLKGSRGLEKMVRNETVMVWNWRVCEGVFMVSINSRNRPRNRTVTVRVGAAARAAKRPTCPPPYYDPF